MINYKYKLILANMVVCVIVYNIMQKQSLSNPVMQSSVQRWSETAPLLDHKIMETFRHNDIIMWAW